MKSKHSSVHSRRRTHPENADATTGVGPDLLTAREGLSAVDAYMLISTCGDLRISEIVDAPNWVVSFYVPRMIFN